jgi:thiamine pyrophosphate-dependent acetolactate synthase large subunit-like protein
MSLNGFGDSIKWLKFKKLKARPAATDADAETFSRYQSNNIRWKRNGNVVSMSADVIISFDGHRSWVVTGKMNDYLLKHEQGHYDITALAAAEFYREVLNLQVTDPATLNDSITEIKDSLQQKIEITNTRYDLQTDHSRDVQAQQKWDQKIALEKQKKDGSLDNLPQ